MDPLPTISASPESPSRRPGGPARAALAILGLLTLSSRLHGQDVQVRQQEGALHGFLTLRTLEGTILADGDMTQQIRSGVMVSEIAFRFRDGSLHHETTRYSQKDVFRLISSHLVQRGPSFPRTLDVRIERDRVTVLSVDAEGKSETKTTQMELPQGLANGLIMTMLKNIPKGAPVPSLPLLDITPTPRLVTLEIAAAGEDGFAIGGAPRKALHYVIKARIGGIAGILAPLLGKQPPDAHVWILQGSVPAFVKAEEPLYVGGPVWRIELASPVWPTPDAGRTTAR